MADFETENGADGEKALDKLGSIKLEFDKSDEKLYQCHVFYHLYHVLYHVFYHVAKSTIA